LEGSGNGISFVGALWGKPGGSAVLLGTLKDMLHKALEMGIFFYRGPILGNMEGCSFPRDFEKRVRFFFQENFYWGV
jgi:hypothetical protein